MKVLAIWTRHLHWWMQRSSCSHSVVSCHFWCRVGSIVSEMSFHCAPLQVHQRKDRDVTQLPLPWYFYDNTTRNLSAIGKKEKSSTAFQQLIHCCKKLNIVWWCLNIFDICFMFALMQCNLDMPSPLAPPAFFIDLAKCNTLISLDGFRFSVVSEKNVSPSFPQITYVVSMFETCCMVSCFKKQISAIKLCLAFQIPI